MQRTEISGLTVRLAQNQAELAAAQRLRFLVFAEEGSAAMAGGHDRDKFDAVCDHLLVIESKSNSPSLYPDLELEDGSLVGTYRLLRQDVLQSSGDFYTAGEFEIAPLIAAKPNLRFMELGRSCVRKDKRDMPVVELLWQGIWNYVRKFDVGVMMGCASFEGTDVSQHAEALSYLAQNARAPVDWQVRAHAGQRVPMNLITENLLDQRAIKRSLPPLIKGYLGLGCYIGEDAVIDRAFNSIDVLILLPVANINPRYFQRFGAPLTN
jgi:L-ornithine Nalpha-acyltransferase